MSIPHLRSHGDEPDPPHAPAEIPAGGARVWPGPVPRTPECADHPLVWLLGAHGGSAVSTLTASLEWAGDAQRRWPSGGHGDSPLVAIVARADAAGLAAAHRVLMAHHNKEIPEQIRLLGLITVPYTDRPRSRDITRELDRVESLAPAAWRLGWIEPWRHLLPSDLPSWGPHSVLPADKRARGDLRAVPVAPIREHLHPGLLAAAAAALKPP